MSLLYCWQTLHPRVTHTQREIWARSDCDWSLCYQNTHRCSRHLPVAKKTRNEGNVLFSGFSKGKGVINNNSSFSWDAGLLQSVLWIITAGTHSRRDPVCTVTPCLHWKWMTLYCVNLWSSTLKASKLHIISERLLATNQLWGSGRSNSEMKIKLLKNWRH